MNRYERTRILVEGDPALAREIAGEIEGSHLVELLDEPREELVMVKVRESARNSLFYLTEALMTSCRVKLEGSTGYGMVLGSNPDLAYNLAVVDAAYGAKNPFPRLETWEKKMAKEASKLERAHMRGLVEREKTRVDFSTMEVDV